MCGITACVRDVRARTNGDIAAQTGSLANQLRASIDTLRHRGPDDSGLWVSADGLVGLGHCRLAINDLSPIARQPLASDDGEIRAVVNGEIYDQDRLRHLCSDQHGYRFSSGSDSELVLALYKIYGSPAFFHHLRGEFAFVLHDGRGGSKRVIAARDRFGIKPLLWTAVGNTVLLASEAKAFRPLGWQPEWDVEAIAATRWLLGERTLFKSVKRLLPGHWLEVTDAGVNIQRYWDADYEDKGKAETRRVEEMVLGVRERLVESVRLRLRADVPVGVYLSGGIDSSAIAGIVTHLARQDKRHLLHHPVPAGLRLRRVGGCATHRRLARVELLTVQVDEEMLARNFADMVYHCEHHSNNLNSVTKFALSELPRERGIKVVLVGEGSDELFAGYAHFAAEFLREVDASQPETAMADQQDLRDRLQASVKDDIKHIYSLSGSAMADGNDTLSFPYAPLFGHVRPEVLAPWVRDRVQGLDHWEVMMQSLAPDARAKMGSRWHPLHSSLYLWTKTRLASVQLSSLGDRTEMAHSVEGRTPFLDPDLAEYINLLPPSVKVAPAHPGQHQTDQGTWSVKGLNHLIDKWILREAVQPFITHELYTRKKHPFLAPMKWPRHGPLHCMFSRLLTRKAVEALGFVDHSTVQESLRRGFGHDADPAAFRTILSVAAWVVLADRFNIPRAEPSQHDHWLHVQSDIATSTTDV
ncbi:hypothetical protein HIM_08761 [Hirsutella minnesotensis 3608]|uniref:Glutamine amidotransferase type-2 domain-containing protein n=1 Tax=Hirsutella minnesotensis 3608 TaxID=1043627 RepID=A0A0F7ZSR7_9HYPO|nr:hypothetical protein HIM_08761 [Hirsutella minnesotensis 3608]